MKVIQVDRMGAELLKYLGVPEHPDVGPFVHKVSKAVFITFEIPPRDMPTVISLLDETGCDYSA